MKKIFNIFKHNNNYGLTDSEIKILHYCKNHMNYMWATEIVSIILKCADWRDAEYELERFIEHIQGDK